MLHKGKKNSGCQFPKAYIHMHNNENMKLIRVASFVDRGQTWELRICLTDPKVKGLTRARNGPSSVPAYSSTVTSEKTHGLKSQL